MDSRERMYRTLNFQETDRVAFDIGRMIPDKLSREFGGKIVFHGGVDTQQVLPNGSEKDVREEVRKIISILNSKGGYILCGSQDYMDDIPIENIISVYDEGKRR